MNEIDLRTKRPATVTTYDTRPVILMTAPYVRKADLTAAVSRLTRRGEVRPLAARPTYNPGTGLWEIQVLRLREPAPIWIKPAVLGLFFGLGLGGLVWLGWWMLTTVSALPLLAFLSAAGLALAVIARAGRPRTVNITQTMNVRIR